MRRFFLLPLVVLCACHEGESDVKVEGTTCDDDGDCVAAFAEVGACEKPVCSQEGQCILGQLPDGTACRDGLACTAPDYCLQGQCTGATVRCVDNNPCTLDSCDDETGCVFTPSSGEACDDLNDCTVGDTCADGQCQPGTVTAGCCTVASDCDDADPCTDDKCLDNGCEHTPNFAPCDDDDPCTGPDHCDGAGACTGSGQVCEDGNPCTVDTCAPDTGLCSSAPAEDGTVCEDGNPCTSDACLDGACVPGSSSCECTVDADCANQEDGDLCNGTLVCVGLRCVVDPLTVVACNPTGDTACVKNTCDPQSGQCAPIAAKNGDFCDDQNPCTTVDQCQNGLCLGVTLSCDDDNPCTTDACSPVVGCTHSDNNLPCSDGTECTYDDQCQGGTCTGIPVACDDDNPCTDDRCDDQVGCRYTNNTAACEDGDSCTANDVCNGGTCRAGASTCACQSDADCATFDDGNRCNGTLVCRSQQCVIDAATVVTCNTSGDTTCKKTRCQPATGQCVAELTANGTPCNDGTGCTLQDQCVAGVCVGQGVQCDDGNPCTNDSCDPVVGCKNVPHSSACDDGNACTTGDVCSAGVCAGSVLVCNDGNECTIDSCDPLQGCKVQNASATTPCDDSSACTTSDHCSNGSCTGTAVTCSDTNPCTQDTCVPATGCSFPAVADNQACSDQNACTGSDRCSAGTCIGTPVICDDDNPCTTDSCDTTTGCAATVVANGTSCQDGDTCTDPDTCQSGVCQPGPVVCTGCAVTGCTDPGPCKAATCDTASGQCVESNDNEGGSCDDGNACTDTDKCTTGTCAGTAKVCNDNNPCTVDGCNPATGCTTSNVGNGTACADADLCDGTETCTGGVCSASGTALVCNDGNPCTNDSCVPATGCATSNVSNGTSCADTDLCDGTETCQSGVCSAGTAVNCNDNNACTVDACTTATGVCTHTGSCAAPTVTCGISQSSVDPVNGVYPAVFLSATGSGGTGALTYSWVVTTKPTGSSATPAPPNAASSSFTPDLAGTYEITVTVTDSQGQTGTCAVTLTANAPPGIRIELVWTSPYGDADLHLDRPDPPGNGLQWFTTNDCFFGNDCGTKANGLNWGQNGGSIGNPVLDQDDTDGLGPENINLDTPPLENGTYTVAVEYYCRHSLDTSKGGGPGGNVINSGVGATTGIVRVFCNGAQIGEVTNLNLDVSGRFIVVGTIQWPGCSWNTSISAGYVGDAQTAQLSTQLPARCYDEEGRRCGASWPDAGSLPACQAGEVCLGGWCYLPCVSGGDCLSGEHCEAAYTPDICALSVP